MTQEQALAILKAGKNVFLTGSAGAGKTYVINKYIAHLKEHKVPVAVTASTGIAATHINGTTIHSWAGIGIKDAINLREIEKLRDKKYLIKPIENTHVLIIDEISMLHRNQLDMVNLVLKNLRNRHEPFGGMQVIFSGDFFQLPPVSKLNETSAQRFAFMSNAWVEAAPYVCYLDTQYRQEGGRLNEILNAIRQGNTDESIKQELLQTGNNAPALEPTKLYSHNTNVDSMNEAELKKVEGAEISFKATKKGNPALMEIFEKSILASAHLKLKKGAKVMFLKNNAELGVMNGTLGVIVGFERKDGEDIAYPVVQLADKRKVIARPEKWSIDNEKGSSVVTFEQVPLRLAWAITVHKSQGMTLDAAEMDLSSCFEAGQGYVALSRLKQMDGLRLLGLNNTALQVDSLASKADKRFKELSALNDQLEIGKLRAQVQNHIIRSGGTTDPIAIKKNKEKKLLKEKKISTYQITVDLIKQNKSLDEIATERGLAMTTIQGHLLHIADNYPTIEIDMYKPNTKVFDEIWQAYHQLLPDAKPESMSKDGRLNSSLVFNKLKAKYDYGTIKLVYAFIKPTK